MEDKTFLQWMESELGFCLAGGPDISLMFRGTLPKIWKFILENVKRKSDAKCIKQNLLLHRKLAASKDGRFRDKCNDHNNDNQVYLQLEMFSLLYLVCSYTSTT